MIYQAKPQRGGRSIPSNTNNPPQDPPAPPVEVVTPETITPVIVPEITKPIPVIVPEITKPIPIVVPEITKPIPVKKPEITIPVKKPDTIVPITIPKKKKVATPVVKITWRLKIVSFFKKLVRRN